MNLKNSRVKWLEDELGDSERFKEDSLAYEKAISEKVYQLNVFVSEEEEEDFLAYMPNFKSSSLDYSFYRCYSKRWWKKYWN